MGTALAQQADFPNGGDCFMISANTLLDHATGWNKAMILAELSELTLAHGVVSGRGPLQGVRFSHGWIEGVRDGLRWAVDLSNGKQVAVPVELYYALGHIRSNEVTHYTASEARRRLVDHAHYGPWEGAALAVGL